MATEDINEPVGMIASFRQTTSGATLARPEIMHWRGRRYRVTQMGMRWPTTKGQRMLHRFTFTIEGTAFETEFNAETLSWHLIRISDGNPG
jgi:hypothetical protein